MASRSVRVVVESSLVCLTLCLALPRSATAQLAFQPGQEVSYKIEKSQTGTVKVLGEVSTTDEKWVTDVTAKAGEADAEGRMPLAITVRSLSGTTPFFQGLKVTQVDYDYAAWDKKKRLPHHSLLQFEAMMKRPLTLLYQPSGKLGGVSGAAELAADIDAALAKGFSKENDFPSARPMYKSIYSEALQKIIWDDLLVFDLPENFEVGLEWKQQRLVYFQPYYAWVNATYVAEDAADGGYTIEATFDLPAAKEASVTLGPQKYLYAVKNGTGTGKYEIDSDGRVRSAETAMHAYFNSSLVAGSQKIPFDQYYANLKYKIERTDK